MSVSSSSQSGNSQSSSRLPGVDAATTTASDAGQPCPAIQRLLDAALARLPSYAAGHGRLLHLGDQDGQDDLEGVEGHEHSDRHDDRHKHNSSSSSNHLTLELSDGCLPSIGLPPALTAKAARPVSFFLPVPHTDPSLQTWLRSCSAALAATIATVTASNPSAAVSAWASLPPSSSSSLPPSLASLPDGYVFVRHHFETKAQLAKRLAPAANPSMPNASSASKTVDLDGVVLRTDPYVLGHPSGLRFRSAPEISPHLLWLELGANGSFDTRDYSTCVCKYCPRFVDQCARLYVHFTRPTLIRNPALAPAKAERILHGPSTIFRRGETIWVPVTFDDAGAPRNGIPFLQLLAREAHDEHLQAASRRPSIEPLRSPFTSSPPSQAASQRRLSASTSMLGTPVSGSAAPAGSSVPMSLFSSPTHVASGMRMGSLGDDGESEDRNNGSEEEEEEEEEDSDVDSTTTDPSPALDALSASELLSMKRRLAFFPGKVVSRTGHAFRAPLSLTDGSSGTPTHGRYENGVLVATHLSSVVTYKVYVETLSLKMIVDNANAFPYLQPPTLPMSTLGDKQEQRRLRAIAQTRQSASTYAMFGGPKTVSFNLGELLAALDDSVWPLLSPELLAQDPATASVEVLSYGGIQFGNEIIRASDFVRLRSTSSDPDTQTNLHCMAIEHILDIRSMLPNGYASDTIVFGGKIYARQPNFSVTMKQYRTMMNAWFPAGKPVSSSHSKLPLLLPLARIGGRFYPVHSPQIRTDMQYPWQDRTGTTGTVSMAIMNSRACRLATVCMAARRGCRMWSWAMCTLDWMTRTCSARSV
ncbi:hypothetical protein BC831DRAFT_142484 [Entophlyctis helioformis]|nr:hypothetical protein BC831DRAFT_142484 [Entophlyctis helioformis]